MNSRNQSEHVKKRYESSSSSSSSSSLSDNKKKRQHHRSHRQSKHRRSRDRNDRHRRKHRNNRKKQYSSSSSNTPVKKGSKKKQESSSEEEHPYFARSRPNAQVPVKTNLIWDGFQWVPRIAPPKKEASNRPQVQLTETDLRTVIVNNLPLELNLNHSDIRNFIFTKVKELNPHSQSTLKIIDMSLNTSQKSVSLELIDQQEIEKVMKLEGQLMLGTTLRVIRASEAKQKNGNVLTDNIQTQAQALAITMAVMGKMKGDSVDDINLESTNVNTSTISKIVKISNIFDRDQVMTFEQFEELNTDMEEELEKFGNMANFKIIKNGEEKLGAEVGSIFVEFSDQRSAETCYKTMRQRVYDGREIKVAFIPETLYIQDLKIN